MHRNLVRGFFRNASSMLRTNGEIHVNHKTKAPFCHWNLEELATQSSLVLVDCVAFKIEDYPGYNNKRGDGLRSDEPFPLGECSTFKFRFSPTMKKLPKDLRDTGSSRPREPHVIHTVRGTTSVVDCSSIFCEYFDHAIRTFGWTDFAIYHSVHEALRLGFERYMGEDPGRSINGYIRLLQELHHLSILRSAWLKQMLSPDHYLL